MAYATTFVFCFVQPFQVWWWGGIDFSGFRYFRLKLKHLEVSDHTNTVFCLWVICSTMFFSVSDRARSGCPCPFMCILLPAHMSATNSWSLFCTSADTSEDTISIHKAAGCQVQQTYSVITGLFIWSVITLSPFSLLARRASCICRIRVFYGTKG